MIQDTKFGCPFSIKIKAPIFSYSGPCLNFSKVRQYSEETITILERVKNKGYIFGRTENDDWIMIEKA